MFSIQEDQVTSYLNEYYATEFQRALASNDLKKLEALKHRVTLFLISEKYRTLLRMHGLE